MRCCWTGLSPLWTDQVEVDPSEVSHVSWDPGSLPNGQVEPGLRYGFGRLARLPSLFWMFWEFVGVRNHLLVSSEGVVRAPSHSEPTSLRQTGSHPVTPVTACGGPEHRDLPPIHDTVLARTSQTHSQRATRCEHSWLCPRWPRPSQSGMAPPLSISPHQVFTISHQFAAHATNSHEPFP